MITRMKKQLTAAVLSVLLLTMCGCRKEPLNFQKKTSDSYPIESKVELTYWIGEPMDSSFASVGYDDLPIKQYLQDATGIDLKFIQSYGESYSYIDIMAASNNLPDIIELDWQEYAGEKLQNLLDNGILLPLNDYIENVSPNLTSYLNERPGLKSNIRTDSGIYYMYPFIREKDIMNNYTGTMLRRDILDNAQLPIPRTITEWESTLKALKQAGLSIPITFGFNNTENHYRSTNPIITGFDILSGFYVVNGKVCYGEYEPAFAEYLRTMARWFEKGLIDPNFYNQSSSKLDELVSEGDVGVLTGNAGMDFGRWIPASRKANENARYEPVPYATKAKGSRPIGGGGQRVQISGYGAAISSQCEYPEIAARFLDFGYSHEGHMIYNFGKAGETYEVVNEYPVYADFITNYQHHGFEFMAQALRPYTRCCTQGPFVQDWYHLEQYYKMDEQKRALEVWNDNDATTHQLPLLTYTTAEGEELEEILNRVNAYLKEVLYKIISEGATDYEIGAYYSTLRSLDIKRAIEIQQTAYNRYFSD